MWCHQKVGLGEMWQVEGAAGPPISKGHEADQRTHISTQAMLPSPATHRQRFLQARHVSGVTAGGEALGPLAAAPPRAPRNLLQHAHAHRHAGFVACSKVGGVGRCRDGRCGASNMAHKQARCMPAAQPLLAAPLPLPPAQATPALTLPLRDGVEDDPPDVEVQAHAHLRSAGHSNQTLMATSSQQRSPQSSVCPRTYLPRCQGWLPEKRTPPHQRPA